MAVCVGAGQWGDKILKAATYSREDGRPQVSPEGGGEGSCSGQSQLLLLLLLLLCCLVLPCAASSALLLPPSLGVAAVSAG
jgi:hypothetical protein